VYLQQQEAKSLQARELKLHAALWKNAARKEQKQADAAWKDAAAKGPVSKFCFPPVKKEFFPRNSFFFNRIRQYLHNYIPVTPHLFYAF
jgi:hypothetical protein